MRLLFVTPKLDPTDNLFGHVNGWAAALARRVERLYVVALWPGLPCLPPNARFATLGKAPDEGGAGSALERARWLLRLQKIVARLCVRDEIDAVLAHMGPVFAVAAAPIARAAGRPTFLWYAHGHVSLMLRLAHALIDGVGTSTPEGFRIASQKLTITGQGIDLDRFRPPNVRPPGERLLSVGRFSPVKDYETLLDALALPALRGRADLAVTLVGGVHSASEEHYLKMLQSRAHAHGLGDRLSITQGVPFVQMPSVYQEATIFASTSQTGSLDKTGLEAAASGLPPIVCNPSFQTLFGEQWPALSFAPGDPTGLATRLADWLARSPDERAAVTRTLRAEIGRLHSVDHWADSVVEMIAREVKSR